MNAMLAPGIDTTDRDESQRETVALPAFTFSPETASEHIRNAMAIVAALGYQLDLEQSVTLAELRAITTRLRRALERLEPGGAGE